MPQAHNTTTPSLSAHPQEAMLPVPILRTRESQPWINARVTGEWSQLGGRESLGLCNVPRSQSEDQVQPGPWHLMSLTEGWASPACLWLAPTCPMGCLASLSPQLDAHTPERQGHTPHCSPTSQLQGSQTRARVGGAGRGLPHNKLRLLTVSPKKIMHHHFIFCDLTAILLNVNIGNMQPTW